jgi:hypothetical protein
VRDEAVRLARSFGQRHAVDVWSSEAGTYRLLEFLVDAKSLCRSGHGMYTRLTDGHAAYPSPRMAKAGIEGASNAPSGSASGGWRSPVTSIHS